jgi:hypothetical protein
MFYRTSIRSNSSVSIPNELDCASEWTFAVLENVAVLWQNIPAYLSYNTKYKPIKYVSVCIFGQGANLRKSLQFSMVSYQSSPPPWLVKRSIEERPR